MIKRCFAFGCSFTHWFYWPTWADFIGINYDEYYNFGMPGSSNKMMHNRVIEANAFYNFTSSDLILIGITNFGRFNWLEDDKNETSWCCHGGPQNWPANEKTTFLKNNFWKQNYGIYDSWLMVKNVVQMFQSKDIKFHFIMSLNNNHFLDNSLFDLSDKEIKMSTDIYNSCLTNISLQEFFKDEYNHPDALTHYQYAEKFIPNLITDKSKMYLDEILSNVDINNDNPSNYSKLKFKYFNDKSPINFNMYGKYH